MLLPASWPPRPEADWGIIRAVAQCRRRLAAILNHDKRKEVSVATQVGQILYDRVQIVEK